jgi:hypothetical protein
MSFTTIINNNYNSISNSITDYASRIPKDTLKTAALIGGLKFTVMVIATKNLHLSVASGVISLTASLVYGAAGPLFQRFPGDTHRQNWFEAAARTAISVTVTSLAATALGYRSLLSSAVTVIGINMLFDIFNPRKVSQSGYIIV